MKWFHNMKIRNKFISSFLLVFFLFTSIGITGYLYISSLKDQVEDLYLNRVVPIEDLAEIRKMIIENRHYLLSQTITASFDEINISRKKIQTNLNEIDKLLVKYKATFLLPSEEEYLKKYDKTAAELTLLISGFDPGSFKESSFENSKINSLSNQAVESLSELIKINTSVGEEIYEESIGDAKTALITLLILMIACLIVSITSGNIIGNIITKPIKKVLFMVQELQKGHIKARANVDTNDELGQMSKTLDQFAHQMDSSIIGALNRIANGDVSFTAPLYDDKDEIAPVLNKTTQTVRELISETKILIESAIEGKLDKRGNAEKFQGGFKEIVAGINSTLDAVIQPVQEGTNVIEKMAKGDLTVKVTGVYKGDHQVLKNSINELVESLTVLIKQVGEAVHSTASSSTEISASIEEIAAGAQEQSSQTAEVATAVEQMTTTILETSRNAGSAAVNAKKAGDIAGVGGKVVEDTVDGINKIAEMVSRSAETVKKLGKNSDQIGEIVQVIDDIADQTNLLALNAAIEAARAGEQGRGFAVVADEVRKLAERTTKATKEIADMIKQIQKDTGEAVESMKSGTGEVEKGKELAGRAGNSLKEIITATTKVVDEISQVASASEEQSTTAEQISKNIEQINNVTQQSAAGTEQVARAAEDLNKLTDDLQRLINRFKIEEGEKETHYAVRKNGKLIKS